MQREFRLGRGLLPFLPTPSEDFQILNISNGTLIINSTSLKAMSCNETDDAWKVLQLPKDGPFTISEQNVFAVIGCSSIGSFMNAQGEGGYCKAACLNQNEPKYCNWYGYCAAGIQGNWQWINFTGGGICYLNFENCGFSTILEPETFSPTHPGWIGSGDYDLKLDWAIDNLNCSNMQFAQTRVEDIFATVKRLTKETAIPMALVAQGSYKCSYAERKDDGVKYCVEDSKMNKVIPTLIGSADFEGALGSKFMDSHAIYLSQIITSFYKVFGSYPMGASTDGMVRIVLDFSQYLSDSIDGLDGTIVEDERSNEEEDEFVLEVPGVSQLPTFAGAFSLSRVRGV
eukprot:Gb_31635 [translate_table: standard]